MLQVLPTTGRMLFQILTVLRSQVRVLAYNHVVQ
jgi:hypothetical protein